MNIIATAYIICVGYTMRGWKLAKIWWWWRLRNDSL